ncbi:MAG: DUF881 domain-containing protein [Bacillota bacterium]|nr:DUF881 domain-containing protein [Bacillota bacterium]MDD3297555.1 DUF881 domain-containing protein [Bacillota bacterium]MDD3850196.1 DUF881 domain-containing protein [Bacillota bacterium]MDD4707260.1 DUF881 domain-containing protein [Bacillota bacterium]
MKTIKAQLSVGLVCLVLGLMLTLQFRNVQNYGGILSVQRAQELASELKDARVQRDSLQQRVKEYESRILQYEESAAEVSVIAEGMRQDLERARLLAGLTDTGGPGVVVTLAEVQPDQEFNVFYIHYDKLLKVLNELNAAGAEAVSINEQRVIATTEIRLAGSHININYQRFAPPFVFKAIGDPQTLEAALKLKGGIVEELEYYGISVSIKKEQDVFVPRYSKVLEFKYAEPVNK